ncbi:uncharacterized protein EHS24_001259 [Apiotrichum porosum]|uniref:Uncharacterized protein n=1 Tax=Apiotrichum porosum TaxID=105984 RepID=A0A427XK26_9TREE|nr:uncharacterized protein EHS24_001259 [Apiotrichum porosum]RSH79220.1 hypothetical protein EHS24_001259 [Apiotrichum porosum]
MVGGFTLPSLPSLPSLPQSVYELLDTSPPVFYPPSRPSSRASVAAPASSCPSSPSPRRRRQRPLSMGDARILFAQSGPLPPFSPTAHPHTDSPLDASREHRPPSEPTSPLLGHTTWGAGPLAPPARPSRPDSGSGHRRSQSVAPVLPSTAPPLQRSRTFGESRNAPTSASCASLPTLDEDGEHRDRLAPPASLFPGADRRSSWLEPSVVHRTQSLHGGERQRRQSNASTLTTASTIAPPTRSHRSSISFSSRARSRNGSISSINGSSGGFTLERATSPSMTASTSISELAVLATWAAEPVISPPSRLSRANSTSTPAESLRARLRTLSKASMSKASAAAVAAAAAEPPRSLGASLSSAQSPQLGATTKSPPATPRSTCGTPGHGTPMGPPGRLETPGSSTPTTSSHGAGGTVPLSPTPTRRYRQSPHLTHKHTHSFPDGLILIAEPTPRSSRPTTSRLRQPPQLHMAVATDVPAGGRSRPTSFLEPLLSPVLVSSPGSLMSDNGSSDTDAGSPTNSVESLALGPPFALQERQQNVLDLPVPPERPARHPDRRPTVLPPAMTAAVHHRPPLPERKPSNDMYTYNTYSTTTIRSRRGSSISIRERRDSMNASSTNTLHAKMFPPHHYHPTHGTRVPIAVLDTEERFLDFDDI